MSVRALLQNLEALAAPPPEELSPPRAAALAMVFARLTFLSSKALDPLKKILRQESLDPDPAGGGSVKIFAEPFPDLLAVLDVEDLKSLEGAYLEVRHPKPRTVPKKGVRLSELREKVGPQVFDRYFDSKVVYSLKPSAVLDLENDLRWGPDTSHLDAILDALESQRMTPRVHFTSVLAEFRESK
jgi:hypothetical protein